jgi:HAD superfamily hydrolase (TIGR01490 family)
MKLALFDLDKTLLPIDTDHAWGDYSTALGWTDAVSFKKRNDEFYEQYKRGELDSIEYVRFASKAYVEQGEARAMAAHADFMREIIRPAMLPVARELIAKHQAAGDLIAMVTATNEFVTRPIAAAWGIDHILAVELVRDAQGWYTSEVWGTPSAKDQKVTRVLQWLQSRGQSLADFEHSVFYTDSLNDVALMRLVKEPVATNPDPNLRRLAQSEGWRILDLFETH